MLAIKKNKIILRGCRNYLDGLWDIPIEKSRLQSDNYNNPAIHGFQYKNQSSNNIQRNCATKEKQTKKDKNFFRLFYGLNKLIDVNECDYLCNNQQKNRYTTILDGTFNTENECHFKERQNQDGSGSISPCFPFFPGTFDVGIRYKK